MSSKKDVFFPKSQSMVIECLLIQKSRKLQIEEEGATPWEGCVVQEKGHGFRQA